MPEFSSDVNDAKKYRTRVPDVVIVTETALFVQVPQEVNNTVDLRSIYKLDTED